MFVDPKVFANPKVFVDPKVSVDPKTGGKIVEGLLSKIIFLPLIAFGFLCAGRQNGESAE